MKSKEARAKFREGVFGRDNHTCVVPWCNEKAKDAHHILDRSLWGAKAETGGYIVDNGASLCALHHKHAECNFFPPEACRIWAGIKTRAIPKALDSSKWYDKHGNILPSPNRLKIKYPSTPHLPFSPMDNPDREDIIDTKHLLNKPLVITIKMDGSNSCTTGESVAARNVIDANHESWDMLKAMHPVFAHKIPERTQVFGEWLFKEHSIYYTDLIGYLQLFGIYEQDTQIWREWPVVVAMAKTLDVHTTPVLLPDEGFIVFKEPWELQKRLTRIAEEVISEGHEGIVVRSAYAFHNSQFQENTAKYVRHRHVRTTRHWRRDPNLRRNKLGDSHE